MNVVQRSSISIAVATVVTSVLILSTGESVAKNESQSLIIATDVDASEKNIKVALVASDVEKSNKALVNTPPPPPGLFSETSKLDQSGSTMLATLVPPVAPVQPSSQLENHSDPVLEKSTLKTPEEPNGLVLSAAIDAPKSNMQAPSMISVMPAQVGMNTTPPVSSQEPSAPQNGQSPSSMKVSGQNNGSFQQAYIFVPVPYLQGYHYQAPRRIYYAAPPQMAMPTLNAPQPTPPVQGSN